jgi:hypothetical protein
MKIRTKSYIEELLPEPKPNSEPLLMGIASAPILQNPMLYEATPIDFLAINFLLAKN